MEIGLVERAVRIAATAHKNRTRKVDGQPYIIHPFMVALKLTRHGFPDTVIAAALIHDVLEDTEFPKDALRTELGREVWEIVAAVTQDDALPWEEKKRRYVEAVRRGPEEARAVAVADKIHNLESLLIAYRQEGPAIWERFNRGKEQKLWFERAVLSMLKETWRHPLIDEYEGLVDKEAELALTA